jgi:gliding motility-associated-like protein
LTYTFAPTLIGTDAFSGSLSRIVGENIGKYSINQGTLSLSGNYKIFYNNDSLSIVLKFITVTAEAKTKVYGDVDPTLTYTYTPTLFGTDTFSGSLSRLPGDNIGKYVINQNTLTLGANYSIIYVQDTLTITTKSINVTAQAKAKVYGEVDPVLTYTYSPALVGTDVFAGSLFRTTGENIGKYAINQGSLTLSNNYTILYNGDSLIINKKSINVISQSKTKVFGETDPELTYTYSPDLIGNDKFKGSIVRQPDEDLVSYLILIGDLEINDNYIILFKQAEFKIIPKNLATLDNLILSSGTLSPAFESNRFNYSASIARGVQFINITPIVCDEHATISINGIIVNNGEPSDKINLAEGTTIITAVVTAQDGTNISTYNIEVNQVNLNPTNLLTPNNDNVNDFWIVNNIEEYPDNRVTIFDRSGNIIYTKKGYNNDWGGTYNGTMLVEDTYYYVIELGAQYPVLKGFITLIYGK